MVKEMAAIVAVAAQSRGIGYKGELPWKLPGDMRHFQKVTMDNNTPDCQNAVLMGRKTWESIPPKFRPLKGRINVVLTKSQQPSQTMPEGVVVASSLQDACDQLDAMSHVGQVFVIGGTQIYEQALSLGWVTRVICTHVYNVPETQKFDAFFPDLKDTEWECAPFDKENARRQTDSASGLSYEFVEFTRKKKPSTERMNDKPQSSTEVVKNTEEMQYLDLCREILETGVKRGDRTGTGTLSKFGTQMRFSLRDGTLPLLTTKRTFWRGVAEELLWFVSGNTNANELAAKDIHIWDGNGSREFLDQRGLTEREVGDLGPVYGFQWRHFGAKYENMHTDYTGQGVDQLADCIHKIIHNPEDRRIIMSAWNPADLQEMALPPCHMFCQFYVDTTTNELSCQMYQRSADMGLGVPFNIASYALLTHMVAHVTGRKPGDFIHTIGDAHIYLNHVDALKEQLTREPRAFPKLKINPEKKNIDDFLFGDFEVIGYNPHKTIKMKMAV
ncbi:Thymidylate synthase [Seminavis robusta]|uniref:Bifunctional dihydrofolate reductase-thymidylate synthase n=1 Tax=Seminavis robusta TaxID=568900 RepID=A0A9N8DNC0_9STRA|nr:Thymidylate synthase [Seminavis robusta]|eukprot:Sro174_g076600.1 Thymidylate synthase (500) ;mRNA; f:28178-29872